MAKAFFILLKRLFNGRGIDKSVDEFNRRYLHSESESTSDGVVRIDLFKHLLIGSFDLLPFDVAAIDLRFNYLSQQLFFGVCLSQRCLIDCEVSTKLF